MREKFEEILKEHSIYGEDVEEILYAVSEMFEYKAERLQKEEPYAVNTIARLEQAAREAWDLGMELE